MKSPRRGAAAGNERSTMKPTPTTKRVKREPARRISNADRATINLLYGPPEPRDQDDDKVKLVNDCLATATNVNRDHENGDAAR